MKTIDKLKFTNQPTGNIGFYTAGEIWGQPGLWVKIYDQVREKKKQLSSFMDVALSDPKLKIVLTGAGTSAFIGLSLTGTLSRNLKKTILAIPTTDLVTHPADFFEPDQPVLLISFARSGNSPESVAAVHLADQICRNVYHLIITCDGKGELANYETSSLKYVFVLPDEANDKSLAMTGSYSGMLLTGLLLSRINEIEMLGPQVRLLSKYANKILDQAEAFRELASLDFERVVFLGSGPLFGTATESHLKVQELTDGRIICKKDTFLGFRHGPKAVINQKTLVMLLFSNQSYVRKYETDLLESLSTGQKPLLIAGIIESGSPNLKIDKLFVLSEEGSNLDEEFLPVCFVIPGQLIGFYKSLQLGMNPDSPSSSGAISRVVTGVMIYPYPN